MLLRRIQGVMAELGNVSFVSLSLIMMILDDDEKIVMTVEAVMLLQVEACMSSFQWSTLEHNS